jgi:hypothetical protein
MIYNTEVSHTIHYYILQIQYKWHKKRNYTGFILELTANRKTPTATAKKAQQFAKPTVMHLMMAEAGRNM